MSHEAARLKRLQVIRSMKKKKVDELLIIKDCCRMWGCSRRTMLEYLKIV